MRKAIPWLGVMLLAVACGSPPAIEEGDESALTTGDWPPAPPPSEGTPDTPIDPRGVRMHLAEAAGQLRLCDLVHLGEPSESADGLVRIVRCAAETGAGWAELRFPPETLELAQYVGAGEQIRVRVEPEPGLHDYIRLTYVASVGETTAREPAEADAKVGSNWDIIATRGDMDVRRCAVDYIGSILPLERGHGADLSHEANVSCRSRQGAHWVRMLFPEVTHMSALRVVRGEVIPARLLNGEGTVPTVRYEGP